MKQKNPKTRVLRGSAVTVPTLLHDPGVLKAATPRAEDSFSSREPCRLSPQAGRCPWLGRHTPRGAGHGREAAPGVPAAPRGEDTALSPGWRPAFQALA